MKYNVIDSSKAFKGIDNYEYALVYMISEIILCKVCDLSISDWSECYEARFFSEDKERHVFDLDGDMRAVEVEDDVNENEIVIKKYCLNNKFKHTGDFLVVQEYLEYDRDGQAGVKLTRLKGVEQEV